VRSMRIVIGLALLTLWSTASAQQHSRAVTDRPPFRHALHTALAGTPASALVLDISSGSLLAAEKPENAAQIRSAPGSILKPFFLAGALESGAIQPQTTVMCHRDLRVLGHNLSCSHPQTGVAFNAEEALAYSCNTYFADLASRLSAEQAVAVLREYGFSQGSYSTSETSPVLRTPKTREDTQLLVLGLEGIRVTPEETAAAYRKLALKFSNSAFQSVLAPVEQGMLDSVRYGAAHNADVSGMKIAGKTGTASDPGRPWTHGWFAGIAGEGSAGIIVVVYLPHGNGADAATIARRFFLALTAGQSQ
jgi:cell division protein FtsI/penicillin-binding protein 2